MRKGKNLLSSGKVANRENLDIGWVSLLSDLKGGSEGLSVSRRVIRWVLGVEEMWCCIWRIRWGKGGSVSSITRSLYPLTSSYPFALMSRYRIKLNVRLILLLIMTLYTSVRATDFMPSKLRWSLCYCDWSIDKMDWSSPASIALRLVRLTMHTSSHHWHRVPPRVPFTGLEYQFRLRIDRMEEWSAEVPSRSKHSHPSQAPRGWCEIWKQLAC